MINKHHDKHLWKPQTFLLMLRATSCSSHLEAAPYQKIRRRQSEWPMLRHRHHKLQPQCTIQSDICFQYLKNSKPTYCCCWLQGLARLVCWSAQMTPQGQFIWLTTVWSEGFLYKVAPPELKISLIMYFVIHNSVVLSKILKIVVPFWPLLAQISCSTRRPVEPFYWTSSSRKIASTGRPVDSAG